MADPLKALARLYESSPVVCNSTDDIRRHLRANRGRRSDRHIDCDITLRQMAIKAGVQFSAAGRAESAPEKTSLATLRRLAAANGQGIAVVFYDIGSEQGE